MSDPLDLERRTYFPALCQGGGRTASAIKYIIIHDTEGVPEKTGAEATAAYFKHDPGGSTQLVVDDDSTERCLSDFTVPCGAPPLNTSGLHVEQSGHANWTRAEWLDELDMIQRCAYKVAQWCKTYSIPRVYLTTADLVRLGPSPAKPAGITQHSQVSAAFHQSTHTDCGPNYPIDVFMTWVNTYYGQLTGTGGFLMALSDAEQAKLLADVEELTAWKDEIGDKLPGFQYGVQQGFAGQPLTAFTGSDAQAGYRIGKWAKGLPA